MCCFVGGHFVGSCCHSKTSNMCALGPGQSHSLVKPGSAMSWLSTLQPMSPALVSFMWVPMSPVLLYCRVVAIYVVHSTYYLPPVQRGRLPFQFPSSLNSSRLCAIACWRLVNASPGLAGGSTGNLCRGDFSGSAFLLRHVWLRASQEQCPIACFDSSCVYCVDQYQHS